MNEKILLYFIIPLVAMASCSGKRPRNTGIRNNRLSSCPDKPNCVSSYETGERHGIKPLEYTDERSRAMERLAAVIRNFSRAEIVTREENYIHAEFRSLVFRFVDDVEFIAPGDRKIIHLRSASRTGYSDLGVNRRRIEKIRSLFQGESGE